MQGMIVDCAGIGPWTVEEGSGTISIRNPTLSTAIIADANAMPMGEATTVRKGDALVVSLPAKALYLIVK